MKVKNYIDLTLGGTNVRFLITSTKGRRVVIKYHAADGGFRVGVPGGRWTAAAERTVYQSADWVLAHLPKVIEDQRQQDAWWAAAHKGSIQLHGNTYGLIIEPGRRAGITVKDGVVRLMGPEGADMRQLVFVGLFRYAEKLLPSYAAEYARQLGVPLNRVTVKKNLRSKWGSASSLGNMTLNWLLIFLPEVITRYLVLHELMHFREMNHSDKFWAWVEKYEPNYLALDRQMQDWGWLFGLFAEQEER